MKKTDPRPFKYEVRSPKFIWAPCVFTTSLCDPLSGIDSERAKNNKDRDRDKNPKKRAKRERDKDNNTMSVTVTWPREGSSAWNSSSSRPRAGPVIGKLRKASRKVC
jgi:hypothetical protein